MRCPSTAAMRWLPCAALGLALAGGGCEVVARLPLADVGRDRRVADAGHDQAPPGDTRSRPDRRTPVPWEAGAAGPAWVISLGDGAASPTALAVDAAGNLYLACSYSDPTTIGTVSLTSSGGIDAALVKLDALGKVTWVKPMATTAGYDAVNSVGLDSAGQVYVAGATGGSTMGTPSVGFVTKLDPGGTMLWTTDLVTGADGLAKSGAAALFVAKDGTSTVTGPGGYVVRVDAAGKPAWVAWPSPKDPLLVTGHGVSVDGSGRTLVAGSLQGTIAFGSRTVTSNGGVDAYVAQLDGQGTWTWAVSAGSVGMGTGPGSDAALQVTADSAGQSTVAGVFSSTASFGSSVLSALGASDVFVARLDADGTFLWALSGGGSLSSSVAGLARDGLGHLTLAGHYEGAGSLGGESLPPSPLGTSGVLLVAKLDDAGRVLWIATARQALASALAVDQAGAPHVAGTFQGSTSFGKTVLSGPGIKGGGMFVARMSPWGTFD